MNFEGVPTKPEHWPEKKDPSVVQHADFQIAEAFLLVSSLTASFFSRCTRINSVNKAA